MREYLKFYIDGQWVDPVEPKTLDVDNPATEQVSGKIAIGSAADVDKAVKAARKAFATWSQTSREERLEVLGRHPRRVPEARRRSGRRGHRGDGRARVAGRRPPGRPRPRPPGHRDRRAEELPVRGAARLDADRQGADRRLRLHHPVELAAEPDRLQGVPGAGHRLHHGAQAVGGGALLGADLRRDHARRRRSGRRVQPGPRRRTRRRRGAVEPPGHRHGVVHRLDPGRHRGGQERRRRPSSASPRNWAARARTSCSTTTTSPRA